MIDTTVTETTREGYRHIHVLEVDVAELADLKDHPVRPHNERMVAHRLKIDWGMAEPGPTDEPRADSAFYLGKLKDIYSVEKRLVEGWKDGADKALKLSDDLLDRITQPLSIRRKLKWADDGDEFDRERLNDGHFDTAWRSTSRQIAVAVPVIQIAMSWGASAYTTHEQFFWTGATALALCRVLEHSGYQTALTIIQPTNFYGDKYQAMCVTVKRAGEYMRADALASVICMGATYRTYGFMGNYCAPFDINSVGSHGNIEMLMPAVISAGAMDVPQITLPDARSKEAARQTIKNALLELQAANLAALPEGMTR